jgi:DNA-binding MarR family transcriptional regulator
MSTKHVQIAPFSDLLRELHGAVIDIVSAVNLPQRDLLLLREAGVTLDRALFPLLVAVERRGPIGIVDLAGRVGRDYTTVSRQIGKLESLGLIRRQENAVDRRVREVVISAKGKRMTGHLDAARERLARTVFETWSQRDLQSLVRLMRRFADTMKEEPRSESQ